MDHKFLEKLPPEEYLRLNWYATHAPKPRLLKEIPQNEKSIAAWKAAPKFDEYRRIFPPYRQHKWAAEKFGFAPKPRFHRGIPPSITVEIAAKLPPKSYIQIYQGMYRYSHYHEKWKMRICEVSVGLLQHTTKYSARTVCRALDYLRKHRYIRLIWRGYPDPEEKMYMRSCYELPKNIQHVQSWRINHGRKRKKEKRS